MISKRWDGSGWVPFGGLAWPRSAGAWSVSGTTPVTAHTVGSWVEVSPSLPSPVDVVDVALSSSVGANGMDSSSLLVISTGASGSESGSIVATINISNAMVGRRGRTLPVPRISPGSRLSVTMRSARTSFAWGLQITATSQPVPITHLQEWGTDPSVSRGLLLPLPGVNDGATWGAWSEVTASTTHAVRGLHASLDQGGATSTSADDVMTVAVGVGASGAEVEVARWTATATASEQWTYDPQTPLVGLATPIPPGSRVAARYTRTSNHPCGLILHGVS